MFKWQIPPRDPAEVSVARLRELECVTERSIRDQHVVSRVLLKGFAAPGHGGKGWQLTPFDVCLGREGKPRGLRVCGRVPDFLLCASESAEQLWGEVENRLGPAIVAARDGRLHDHDSHVSAIRDGIALHLARSLRYLEINRGAVGQAIEHVRRTAPAARRALLEAEFQRLHGLVPAGPEALVTLLEGAFDQWRSLDERGVIVREGVEAMFRRVSDAFRLQEVEVWHVPPGHELLISDSPAIAFRYSDDCTRIQADVAVGDASGIALPLARDCLAVIGPKPKDEGLLPGSVELFNRLQVEGARRYVYYHPDGRLKAFVQTAIPPADLGSVRDGLDRLAFLPRGSDGRTFAASTLHPKHRSRPDTSAPGLPPPPADAVCAHRFVTRSRPQTHGHIAGGAARSAASAGDRTRQRRSTRRGATGCKLSAELFSRFR